jgi:hypothetical protein
MSSSTKEENVMIKNMLLSLEAKQIVQAVKLGNQNAHSEFNYRRIYFCFMSL